MTRARLVSSLVLLACAPVWADVDDSPAHPRLLFAAADVPELAARRFGAHAEIWEAVVDEVGGYPPPPPTFGAGGSQFGERVAALSIAVLVDPGLTARDGRPLGALLLDYVDAMRAYPEWYEPYPFGDDRTISSYLFGLSLAYDCHQDLLGAERSQALREQLLERAQVWSETSTWLQLEDNLDPEGRLTWQFRPKALGNHATRNYLGIAAVAHALDGEADTSALLDRLALWRELVLAALPSDGADTECAYYHAAGLRDLLLWLQIHDRAHGTNSLDHDFFRNVVLYDRHTILPGGSDDYGGALNFGDGYPAHGESVRSLAARLGAALGDGTAQWMAEELDQDDLDWATYLWFDPAVAVTEPAAIEPFHHFPERGLFCWRSSWDDDAITFALESGAMLGGHDHPDAGGFLLYRGGVPYLTDYGYSDYTTSDEQNLLLIDGVGQRGEGLRSQEPQDPDLSGTLEVAIADAAYFDLLADPTLTYPAHADGVLERWTREVIGFESGVFLVRDEIRASRPVTSESLLHGYCTEPYAGPGNDQQYRASLPWEQDPWRDLGGGLFSLTPRPDAAPLHVQDASSLLHDARIEPSSFIPHKLPDGSSNGQGERLVLGTRLVRSAVGARTSSVIGLSFDPGLVFRPLVSSDGAAVGEGVQVLDARLGGLAAERLVVVWPAKSRETLGGLTLTGAMGGRSRAEPAAFGRGLTWLSEGRTVLVEASTPVDVYTRLESSSAGPRFARVRHLEPVSLQLYCPSPPRLVRVDGKDHAFRWTAGRLVLELTPTGAERWIDVD